MDFSKNVLNNVTGIPDMYEKLDKEIKWLDNITHQGGSLPRLFAIQADISDKNRIPLYRHPLDNIPQPTEFSPTVFFIKNKLENACTCVFNHVLVQKYRNGADFINDHSDKTLDIQENSLIASYSAGTTRVMKMRRKRKDEKGVYEIQNVNLPHDSAFVLTLDENRLYTHGIRKNCNISEPRISLTFRNIATFFDPKNKVVTGKGSVLADTSGMTLTELLHSWKDENARDDFTWDELYEKGFGKYNLS